ncbi:DUF2058 family protein [Stenotrophomonas maltophilia]|uniref:DUF2058 family protein n=1 Tax=Stenotrophomonas maltophilia TaxID=40324 RepID=UPI001094DFE9|nr:DUF2058 family protein [Stenotrophomonas maltophilia]
MNLTDLVSRSMLTVVRGTKPIPKPDPKPQGGARPDARGDPSHAGRRNGQATPRAHGEGRPHDSRNRSNIGLAKAYAIRAQKEKEERATADRRKREDVRQRRETSAWLEALLKEKALNDPDAEIARHFLHSGKIMRIYVNAWQLKALNAGDLGVVQLNGRYVLVSAAVLALVESIFAPAVALNVDPDAPTDEDPYVDPKHRVPDDLGW